MSNKLRCEIVQDLLPSYVDGLTNEVTNEAIEEHVAECENCRTSLEAMCTPEVPPQEFEEKQEIDFLKKTKKKTRRTVLGILILAVVAVCVIVFARFYLVGSSLHSESIACKVDVSGRELTVTGAVVDSGLGVSSIDYEEENGVVTIQFEATLASPFHSGDFQSEYTAEETITQVRVGDRIVWDNGSTISAYVSAVYNAKHPYVGDMPANGDSVKALGLPYVIGGFTNELQTMEEPYGWTLIMEDDYSAKKIEDVKDKMTAYAYVLMATIDNLDVVTYQYTVDGVAEELTITAQQATSATGKDIKLWAETPALLQELMESLRLDTYAAASRQNGMESIFINIVNATDEEIYSIGVEYSVNGDSIGGGGMTRADGEPLSDGASVRMELNEMNFQDVEMNDTTEIQVVVNVGIRTPGTEFGEDIYTVENQIVLNGGLGYDYNYVLTGSVEEGFLIE